jgi:hypothetical protein
VERENRDEMQERMLNFESNDLAFFQSGAEHVLRGIFHALDQATIGSHAAWKDYGGLVRTEFGLKRNLLKPVHLQTISRETRPASKTVIHSEPYNIEVIFEIKRCSTGTCGTGPRSRKHGSQARVRQMM